ncbi:hypothetical protein GUITHDRAFT_160816 [Guillardia theta CCMP2712]|uniref:Uncharacterized protein n=1 Tax=Guillardia theta (strain CCMP2712) TaxID=905079 RepID=L1K162_GUITC|nr:hypothetical protein GUITHDRAFT_160816 [Guillardia theta CCMP2712]EKX54123.1 hypothetical protein GUITHDRAFT_160816 [Guillardia theta CCMP2712]|mmetsp:Transcript_31519/g.100839  ORF Transcript_31519/g.100839 Transcript_31519/m.100839 type:complete len:235 (-) Transcript_31519:117-821(-)|eukprot:XP_005841103.1 hypothetical protein GUITHDRAFT_160816 [Guillardia theta CCMP2712]
MCLDRCLRTLMTPSGFFLFLLTQCGLLHTALPQEVFSCCGSVCRSNAFQQCQGVPSCWAWTNGECCRGGCTCRWKTGNKVCKVNKNNGELNECKENNNSMEYDGCIDYTDEARKEGSKSSLLFYIVPGVAVFAGAVYLFCMRGGYQRNAARQIRARLSVVSTMSRRSEYFSANLPEIFLQALQAPVQRQQIWNESVPPIAFDLYISGVVLSVELANCTTERPEQDQDKSDVESS